MTGVRHASSVGVDRAIGARYAATGGWTVPLVLVSALATGFGAAGVAASRPVVVTGDRAAAG